MRLSDLLGINVPIIQAPMAGAQGHALALAVCEAGGLGSLPCAMLTPAAIGDEVAALRAGTRTPFNLNFFCHTVRAPDAAAEARWRAVLAPYYTFYGVNPTTITAAPARTPFDAATADLVESLRPPVVSFHFGLPNTSLLARVRASGARILASATTVREARWLAERGVDAVIAQGLEAGGHRGHFLDDDLSRQLGTFALLPQVVAAVRVPVIAAGGIATAATVAAAFALGAAGVQAGTAFLLSPEATTHPLQRAALGSADAEHTALTNLFTGRPARGIVNRAMRELGLLHAAAPAFPFASAAMAPLRAAAEARGRADFTPLWAGQNASACRPRPAAELLRELARGIP